MSIDNDGSTVGMFGVGRLLQEPEEEEENIAEDDDDEVEVDIKPETDEITSSNTKTQFANFSGLI